MMSLGGAGRNPRARRCKRPLAGVGDGFGASAVVHGVRIDDRPGLVRPAWVAQPHEPRTPPHAVDDRRDVLRPRNAEAVRVVRGLRPGRDRAVLRVAGAAAGPAPRHRRRLDGDRLRHSHCAWPGHAAGRRRPLGGHDHRAADSALERGHQARHRRAPGDPGHCGIGADPRPVQAGRRSPRWDSNAAGRYGHWPRLGRSRGAGWTLVALGAGAAGAAAAISQGRQHPEAPPEAEPAGAPATPEAPPAPEPR